jgi:GxxExxY protein
VFGTRTQKAGLKVLCEVAYSLNYEGLKVDAGYRIDMLVEDQIVIESKTVERILPIHEAQLMTYLRLTGCKIGFLLNWNVALIKNGLRRRVNNL